MLWPFDFALVEHRDYGTAWFDTAPLEPFEVMAQRSSGCVYALTGPQRRVLLVTSEGQAGIVARACWNVSNSWSRVPIGRTFCPARRAISR